MWCAQTSWGTLRRKRTQRFQFHMFTVRTLVHAITSPCIFFNGQDITSVNMQSFLWKPDRPWKIQSTQTRGTPSITIPLPMVKCQVQKSGMWSTWHQLASTVKRGYPAAGAAGAEDPARPRSSPRRPLSGGTKAAVAYESWVGPGAGGSCSSVAAAAVGLLHSWWWTKIILIYSSKKNLHSNMLRSSVPINVNQCAIPFGLCRDHIQPASYINERNLL